MLIVCTKVETSQSITRNARVVAEWLQRASVNKEVATSQWSDDGFIVIFYKPLAVVWLNDGSLDDLDKARGWASTEGWKVRHTLMIPNGHESPQQWGRAVAIAEALAEARYDEVAP